MKYLKEFENEADVKMGVLPNVVLANDTNKVLYNVEPIFVYIQHIDGRLIKPAQWEAEGIASSEANGVAVVTDEASFVIKATEDAGGSKWAEPYDTHFEGVFTTTDMAIALTDFGGRANTEAMLVYDTFGAAKRAARSFPNGQKGYLPSLGELNVAYSHKSAINKAMQLINGVQFGTAFYWSSTQYSDTKAWQLRMFNGSCKGSDKDISDNFRAFTELVI